MAQELRVAVEIDLGAEVLALLSYGIPKDALDLFQEVRVAIRLKINKEAAKHIAALPRVLRMQLQSAEPEEPLNYDLVVIALTHLVNDGKATIRCNSRGEPEYLRR